MIRNENEYKYSPHRHGHLHFPLRQPIWILLLQNMGNRKINIYLLKI
jgi:hypothetical protein